MLSENPIRAPENPELGALHVDLEQRDRIFFVEIIIQREQRHSQDSKALRLQRVVMQGRAGLLAYWDIQIMIAGMRIDGFGFDLHVAKLDRPADVLQAVGQVWLWLERNHPAIPAPARQPVDEAALVGANVADDVTWPDVPPDNFELGFLMRNLAFNARIRNRILSVENQAWKLDTAQPFDLAQLDGLLAEASEGVLLANQGGSNSGEAQRFDGGRSCRTSP